MNITIELQVPKEIPSWFRHEEAELPEGFSKHDPKFTNQYSHPIFQERNDWADNYVKKNKSKNIFSKETDKYRDWEMAAALFPKRDELIRQSKLINEWVSENNKSRYEQWHKYYIAKIINENSQL